MNTENDNAQMKKMGKIEGVIYMADDNTGVTASANNQPNGELPFHEAGLPQQTAEHKERTKGVQTYIPISQYRRLSNQKLSRPKGTTIATLAAEAISLWLDVQEDKLSVSPK